MKEVPVTDIPAHLKTRFDEENMINAKLDQDQIFLSESGSAFIVTFDIIKDWSEIGIMQTLQDIYQQPQFLKNDE